MNAATVSLLRAPGEPRDDKTPVVGAQGYGECDTVGCHRIVWLREITHVTADGFAHGHCGQHCSHA